MRSVSLGTLTGLGQTTPVQLDTLRGEPLRFAVFSRGSATGIAWRIDVSADGVNWTIGATGASAAVAALQCTAPGDWVRVNITAGSAINIEFLLVH